jgi:hypothetical protein
MSAFVPGPTWASALWLTVAFGPTSCSRLPKYGSPEDALRRHVARERSIPASDVAAECTCGPVLHIAWQCRCSAEVYGLESAYHCECPAGTQSRWLPVPKPCTCDGPQFPYPCEGPEGLDLGLDGGKPWTCYAPSAEAAAAATRAPR